MDEDDLNELTRLVLFTATHFRGIWNKHFSWSETYDAQFWLNKVKVLIKTKNTDYEMWVSETITLSSVYILLQLWLVILNMDSFKSWSEQMYK